MIKRMANQGDNVTDSSAEGSGIREFRKKYIKII